MAIKRYFSDADNTITNAFRPDLTSRGTNANMGESDVLEVFSIYGQASSGSTELERILIKFPISDVISDRTAGSIPVSGGVSFYLKMSNARHSQTVPRDFTLNIYAVSRSWEEGFGLDMDGYTDIVYPGNIGSTWMSASQTTAWSEMGGDYHSSPIYTDYFETGIENLEVDVTPLVEQWITGSAGGGKENYGFGVHLTGTQEAYYSGSAGADSTSGQLNNLSGSQDTFYTKKFFGRGSEFYYKRPYIEARWDSSIKDDRGRMYVSSSRLTAEENMHSIYFYNIFGGHLRNVPEIGTGSIYVQLYASASGGTQIGDPGSKLPGSWVSTGIYKLSFPLGTSGSPMPVDYTLYDRWYNAATSSCYFTGSFTSIGHQGYGYHPASSKYISNITNLQAVYTPEDEVRLRLYARPKNWSPTIYTVANSTIETSIINSASYMIYRIVDDLKVLSYGTGSDNSTMMSYDVSGNYFDLDMGLFESGYAYGIRIAFYDENSWVEQPYTWKFRVDKLNEY
jgi:hypothetical protein